MARKFLTAIDLSKNELQNAAVQNLASAPAAPVKGQLYYNSTGGDDTLYWWNGTTWVAAKAGGAIAFGSVVPETTFGGTSADGVATTAARSDHKHANPLHDAAAHSTIPLNSLATATGDISMGGHFITNLSYPNNGSDAATKQYADQLAQGLDAKQSVKVASTGNLTLSGFQTIDGVALSAAWRILVKDQTAPAQNGIYLMGSGAWVRVEDMDTWAEVPAAYCWVEEGATWADTGWLSTADFGGTLGTTAITWTQFSGAGQITAGAGLTKSGNTINAVAGDTTLTIAADDMRVNTTVIATVASLAAYTRKFAVDVAAATSTAIAHNLNTRDVTVDVYRTTTPFDSVECDVERTDANNVTVRFATAPTAGAYRVVVVG